MTDNRLYTVNHLREFFDGIRQDNNYLLEFKYSNNDTARARLPGSRTTPSTIYQYIECNEEKNDTQVTRIRLYNESDPKHSIVSCTRELFYKMVTGSPGYDPNAPRLNYDIGEVETRTARLQILMRPTIKKELKRLSELHGTTMSTVIDDLVSTWINKLQNS